MTVQTRNITRLFRSATPVQIQEGADWYSEAHQFARNIGGNLPIETTVGVIAALSPNNGWGQNKQLAERFIAEGGLTSGYFGQQLGKATLILKGAAPLEVLGGKKTINFYTSILTEGREGTCIDRHAYCLAANERMVRVPNLAVAGRYEQVAELYSRATKIMNAELGLTFTPAQTQATVWELWRQKFWRKGAFQGA
jgi:hypothetical protein